MSAGDRDNWRQYVKDGFLSREEVQEARETLSSDALSSLRDWAQDNPNSVSDDVGGGILGNLDVVNQAVDRAISTVLNTMFSPIFKAIYLLFAIFAAVVAVGFLGTDLALDDQVHGIPGVADLPILLVQMGFEATEPVGNAILSSIGSINATLINFVATQTGFAAAPLMVLLQALELGLLLFLADLGRQAGRSLLSLW